MKRRLIRWSTPALLFLAVQFILQVVLQQPANLTGMILTGALIVGLWTARNHRTDRRSAA